mmetsp:Transcript_6122/g.14633  ORF Transcript_6122/g.14633 Transcript_6122/m.14633 type:complete len:95 (+) Transcript_6122:251-535(+)
MRKVKTVAQSLASPPQMAAWMVGNAMRSIALKQNQLTENHLGQKERSCTVMVLVDLVLGIGGLQDVAKARNVASVISATLARLRPERKSARLLQ